MSNLAVTYEKGQPVAYDAYDGVAMSEILSRAGRRSEISNVSANS